MLFDQLCCDEISCLVLYGRAATFLAVGKVWVKFSVVVLFTHSIFQLRIKMQEGCEYVEVYVQFNCTTILIQ